MDRYGLWDGDDIVEESTIAYNVDCGATIQQQGQLGEYPNPVWYNPHGIANVLSMHNLAQHYRLAMDTNVNTSIHLCHDDGTIIPFTPSQKGLYRCDMDDEVGLGKFWSLITTVADKSKYLQQSSLSFVDLTWICNRMASKCHQCHRKCHRKISYISNGLALALAPNKKIVLQNQDMSKCNDRNETMSLVTFRWNIFRSFINISTLGIAIKTCLIPITFRWHVIT